MARVIITVLEQEGEVHFSPQIHGGPQIFLNFNLLASLNLLEIKVRLLVINGSLWGSRLYLCEVKVVRFFQYR